MQARRPRMGWHRSLPGRRFALGREVPLLRQAEVLEAEALIWKILSATAAVFTLVIGYFAFVPATSTVLTNLLSFGSNLPYWSSISQGVNQVASNAFMGFVAGIIIALIAVVIYLAAASQQDESVQSEF